MEKNNQPLILGIVVIGAVLIIALALIFTRNSDDTATETASENNTSENQENVGTGENGENGGEQTTPQPDPQPTPQPAPDPDSFPPDPQPDPQPQPGVLPPNWNSLTDREKTELNPYDCDHETQWVSAEDGSCINKTTDDDDPTDPVRPPVEPDYVLLDINCYDPPADPPWFEVCDISIATTGNDNLEQFLAEIVLPVAPYAEWVWVVADVYGYNGYDNLSEYAGADFILHTTKVSNPDHNPDYWDGFSF